jgi:DNA polymerase III subunit epsilon
MKVLLCDVETTGLEEQDVVIEVACTLYSLPMASPIESYACVLKGFANPASHVNGIKPELLKEHGLEPADVWGRVGQLAQEADCMAAHRAEFDKRFVDKAMGDQGWKIDKPWVCTKTDIRWPGGRRGDHLVQLALSLGLGVASAHRAMADVDTMSRILTRVAETGVDLVELFRLGMRPKKRYVAKVPFDMNPVLKENGFLWDADRKQWYRNMPPEEVDALTFRVTQQD